MAESCLMTKPYVIMTINVAMHVLILFTILSLFFMLYIAPVEKKALDNELENQIDDLITSNTVHMSEDLRKIINSDAVNKMKEVYSKPHKLTTQHNSWLFTSIVSTNIAMFLLVTISTLLLIYQCDKCIPIGHVMTENIITFIFVGIVEYLFFTRVALKYIPSPPSAIVKRVLTKLKNI